MKYKLLRSHEETLISFCNVTLLTLATRKGSERSSSVFFFLIQVVLVLGHGFVLVLVLFVVVEVVQA